MTQEEYKARFSKDDAPGWEAIDAALEKLYGAQEPQHFAPIISSRFGGDDPLDGISIYESNKQEPHFHFVSYGMSFLYYDDEYTEEEYSGWGFEFTYRMKKQGDNNIYWVQNLMQNLARYVNESKRYFDPYHFIPANGPIRLDYDTDITALAFAPDPELGTIDTPNGKVQFLQMVGLTSAEYEYLKPLNNVEAVEALLKKMQQDNPLLITDLDRK
jgi:riboflavin biosynthesis protein